MNYFSNSQSTLRNDIPIDQSATAIVYIRGEALTLKALQWHLHNKVILTIYNGGERFSEARRGGYHRLLLCYCYPAVP